MEICGIGGDASFYSEIKKSLYILYSASHNLQLEEFFLAACRRDRFWSSFCPTLGTEMVNNNILQPTSASKQAQNSDDGPYSDRLLEDKVYYRVKDALAEALQMIGEPLEED